VKVAHILVSDKALAEELLQQLKAGADFAALAKEHSLDKESVAHGGLLPWFSRGQMEAHFEEAAFSLEPGQISSVIETSHGYHIIRAESKEPAKKQSFSEVAKQASDQALLAKQDAVWSEYRRQLRGRKLILLFSR
jgi:parvulin-like peptidyl-prolyl isomerase